MTYQRLPPALSGLICVAMPVSPDFRPDSRFMTLGAEYADPVAPADFPRADIRLRNHRQAARIGLDTLTDDEWRSHFAWFEPLPGAQPAPLAMRYHGHQFRTYNPDLGDGRGFLFAQVRDVETGRLLDLGTKGSGQTPWSRQGDGRLTLKGGVREALATAMLEAQGVSTSKTFSLIETGEHLARGDEPSPTRSAVLTRLSWSHVRFGTFQRHAYNKRPDLIERLVAHVLETYYPEVEALPSPGVALFEAVVDRAATLAASWMASGFVHGVLNTDNMNITGESFDYGPYRFLPYSDPNFVAAYFDHSGLYSFGRQPEAVFWNLQQLAGCLSLISDRDHLVDALNSFGPKFRQALAAAIVRRLGVISRGPEADEALADATFRALAEGGEALRWEPIFFDWFGGTSSEARALSSPRARIYEADHARVFREHLSTYRPDRPERLQHPIFAASEPEELIYEEIETLWAAIAEHDDWAPFQAKLARLEAAREAWNFGTD